MHIRYGVRTTFRGKREYLYFCLESGDTCILSFLFLNENFIGCLKVETPGEHISGSAVDSKGKWNKFGALFYKVDIEFRQILMIYTILKIPLTLTLMTPTLNLTLNLLLRL